MDWKSKEDTKKEQYSWLKAYNEQFEEKNESVIDHDSMFGHVHQKIQSSNNNNSKSVKKLSAKDRNGIILKDLLDNHINVIKEEDVEDSDNMPLEDIKKEIKNRPQPGIKISGQHEKMLEKIKEESKDSLFIEIEDEKHDETKINKESDKTKSDIIEITRHGRTKYKVEYDKDVYNKLIILEKEGDYSALIEYYLDAMYKAKDKEQKNKIYNAIDLVGTDLRKDEEKHKQFIVEIGKISTKYDYEKGLEKIRFEENIKSGDVPGTESLKQDEKTVSIYADAYMDSYDSEFNNKKQNLNIISEEFCTRDDYTLLYNKGEMQEQKNLAKQENKTEDEIKRIALKGNSSTSNAKLREVGYTINVNFQIFYT